MAEMDMFELEIISPDREFYKGEAGFVEMKTSEGEIGVYKNHVPTTYILVPGVIKIYEEKGTKKAAIHGGFVEILKDRITVMAEIAEWPEEIDEHRAEEARVRAERRINGSDEGVNMHRAELALRRSLARLEAKKIK
ncbi:MAG: ATP synthase F1 subunit epsilon [Lachnospiraceae bacterium]|nr:ATP synthase F1 subunit epsilon [Lachnospiraceae bacterium]MBQ4069364.1 ATP synthase F1 subunit epsilon [Lachnospiraceae bacterium]